MTPAFAPPPGTQPDEAIWRRRTQAADTALTQHPWLRDYLPATNGDANQSAPAPSPTLSCDDRESRRHSREGGNPASRTAECDPAAPDSRAPGHDASKSRRAPTIPLNPLIHAHSPYLLQHAFNPIDWREHPGPDLGGDRLRLISIGYSTCYWCHRMAEDAFSDPVIGTLLNTRFHAIKIDREQHPEVDAHYTRLQRLSGGEVGWPVTVVENADGEVLFVGSYLAAADLLGLLQRLDRMHRQAPAALASMAASFRTLQAQADARAVPNGAGAARIEPTGTAAFLRDDWDAAHGGRRGVQKFPDPPLLDWLLDRALREPDSGADQALALQLDRMLASGLFDPLHGGFFRYSTQADWSQPHYEKMLHTQAQLMRIYARAGAHWQRPAWQAAAERIAQFSRDWLGQADGLLASAVDARFAGREGGYYLVTPEISARLRSTRPWLAEDPLGSLRQLRLDPSALALPELGAALADLAQAAPPSAPRPFVDGKTLTDWNALHADALLVLAGSFASGPTRAQAGQMLDRLWQRFDPASGVLQRDQHGGIAGSLSDYALLARALLAQHMHPLDDTHLARSGSLLRAATARYLADADQSTLLRGEPARDSELPAPLAELCLALHQQSQRDADEAWKTRAARCIALLHTAAAGHAGHDWSAQRALAVIEHGGVEPIAFFGDGVGRALLRTDPQRGTSVVRIALQPGWHVNAHDTGEQRLIPTRLQATDDQGAALAVRYPDGVERDLAVFDAPLRLYEAEVDLHIEGLARRAGLQLQACNDRICLLPQTLRLYR